MKLKSTSSRTSALLRKGWGRQKYRLLTFVAATALYTALVFSVGAKSDTRALRESAGDITTVAANAVRGKLFARPKHINIDIKHKHFQRLAYKREMARVQRLLITESDDYVPATIRYNNETIRVKMRLKGDLTDHLETEKWSFRVKVRGDSALFGLKVFSLQHPDTRNFMDQWFFHQVLKHEGVLALRYDFIHVTLNGKDLGIYALEEHFEKRLIEHNRRREGPILRFGEGIFWEEKLLRHDPDEGPIFRASVGTSGTFQSSPIDAFRTTSMLADPVAYPQFLEAVSLLEAFRTEKLPTHEVFDAEKMASFFAVSDLLGASHGTLWNNMRFYFNPVSGLLEPIGYDCGCIRKATEGTEDTKNRAQDRVAFELRDMMMRDLTFVEAYGKALERVSDPAYLDAIFAESAGEMSEKMDIVHSEFPFYRFPKEILYFNQKIIRSELYPAQGIHAYWDSAVDDTLTLDLGNIQELPVEVFEVVYRDSLHLPLKEPALLPGKVPNAAVSYQSHRLAIPPGVQWRDTMATALTAVYRLLGSAQSRQVAVVPHPRVSASFGDELIRQLPNAESFDFLRVDHDSRQIWVKPGAWTLTRSLVLPEGYTVNAGPGTRIDLKRGAGVLSRSPLRWIGTEDEPITIHSSDSTGQGLTVLDAQQESTLEHVIFDNLSNPAQEGWSLPGAVTFYKSPLKLTHGIFSKNRSEDALNVINTTFAIDRTTFSGTASDAFDGDFTTGRITNSWFVDPGNDAVDVSGSVVELEGLTIINPGDKGLSAGEDSEMTASGIEIDHAEIAVAAKDQSAIELSGAKISNCRLGFAVFQKKPEFGVASVNSRDLTMDNVEERYLLEEGSALSINGKAIKPNRKEVRDALYGVEYGKATK